MSHFFICIKYGSIGDVLSNIMYVCSSVLEITMWDNSAHLHMKYLESFPALKNWDNDVSNTCKLFKNVWLVI